MKPILDSDHSAFSLVEVTIAIGIVAFALTAVVSLFSVMLGTERGVITQTSIPSIATSILHTIKVARESEEPITEAKTFYFSNEGESVDSPVAAAYSCLVTPLRLDPAGPGAGVLLIRVELRRANTTQVLKTLYATVSHR